MNHNVFAHLKNDLFASLVVFLVALPLCLGIALASNAPLFSGIIAGVIGGIVVGIASGSALGVSGPAAGLVAIVISSLELLGSWETFLLAGVIAGLLQLLTGYLRGGIIAYYFPSSVIKGMLAGIGIIIILKQIPHLLGHEVSSSILMEPDGDFNITRLKDTVASINPGVILISVISLFLMVLWEKVLMKKYKIFEILQAPLVVVIIGILLSTLYEQKLFPFMLEPSELVQLPEFSGPGELLNHVTLPDFSQLTNWNVYKVAIVIALIASLETLLCVEATDKLDPHKRVTPTDRELKAQGLGNILSSFIGGLPITQVIVRSTANITFGAKTKLSTILHGVFLLLCVVTIPAVLNKIPLASLASILVIIGYKLATPVVFKQMYRLGWEQFLPFLVTIAGIIMRDLLFGITLGFSLALFIILRHHYLNSHDFFKIRTQKDTKYYLHLAEQVSFLNKGSIIHELKQLPKGVTVVIDGSDSKIVDPDVKEVIHHFVLSAKTRDIKVELRGV
ncbi:SulP family inorganic anion transporter [Legionella clemsonensis]|uniref:C4-dicarboxylic acid transporter DauA n=1 Tax=Legionella clemsonensis TaxID=1867846 RepID=A0A222P438_9GAMM|nr:SulP family inorganic anion transporter [Legionella clemsonensis]ASQ46545.1 C4-dicarboxylic acid transporter DauA [Legionella clemsonensis]